MEVQVTDHGLNVFYSSYGHQMSVRFVQVLQSKFAKFLAHFDRTKLKLTCCIQVLLGLRAARIFFVPSQPESERYIGFGDLNQQSCTIGGRRTGIGRAKVGAELAIAVEKTLFVLETRHCYAAVRDGMLAI